MKNISDVSEYIFNYYPQIRKGFRALLSKKDLPISMTQLTCLHIVTSSGPLTMSEVANKLSMSSQQLTKVVDALVEFKMVTRTIDERNRRQIIVTATDYGKELLQSLKDEFTNNLATVASCLPSEATDKMVENIKELSIFLDLIKNYYDKK